MQYTKLQINNSIRRVLEEGGSNDDALDLFLKMSMVNDLGPERPFCMKGPSPSEIHFHLIGNDVINRNDFKLELTNGSKIPTQRLMVKLSPTCTLYAEMSHSALQININQKNMTFMYLKSYWAKDIALWMIRQKQNLEKYQESWNTVLDNACKKAKSNRMAYLGIRAIFTDAMKAYPEVKYVFVEQKRRVRIRVMIPDSHLGVYIDAWWGSYKKRLPKQIESLKLILDVHSKSDLKNFFVYH